MQILGIKPSLRFISLLLQMHLLAATAVLVTDIPFVSKLALIMSILLSLYYLLARNIFLHSPGSWCEISINRDDVSVVTRNGKRFSGKVECNTVISPFFAVLCVRPEKHRTPIFQVIFPDALGEEGFRKMCILLKYNQ